MWCIFYDDGSTYSAEDGPPETAPGRGVQIIAQPDRTRGTGNVGYLTLAGYDFYFWHLPTDEYPGEWAGARTETDMWELILDRAPIEMRSICKGRLMLPKTRFVALLEQAQEWAAQMRLPAKSGFQPGERNE